MFGDKRLYKKLEVSGLRAPAEVTAIKEGHITAVAQPGVAGTKEWKVSVTVRPEGETPFPATIVRTVELGGAVLIGSIISVLYDPNDHAKVMEERGLSGAIDKMALQLGSKPRRQTIRFSDSDPEYSEPAADDTASQLSRLTALRDRGVLSPEEFDAQKSHILDQGN
jgi:hypothetical protein